MRKGRTLELLLKRIQEFKYPDAKIESPEFVTDVDTGTKREVDISIRQKKDNSEVFIAIECRDREGIQDIQWVEQLISKKESIQADALIAVTGSDFTTPPKIKARKRGVILKKIDNDVPAEVRRLLNEILVEFKLVRPVIRQVDIKVPDFFSNDLSSYKYYVNRKNKLSFEDFVSFWNTPNLVRSVCGKIDDFEKGKFIKFDFPTTGSYILDEQGKKYPIEKVQFVYELNYRLIKLPLTSVMLYQAIEDNVDEAVIYEYVDGKTQLSEVILDKSKNEIRWDIYAKDFIDEGMVLIGSGLKSEVPVALTMIKLDL